MNGESREIWEECVMAGVKEFSQQYFCSALPYVILAQSVTCTILISGLSIFTMKIKRNVVHYKQSNFHTIAKALRDNKCMIKIMMLFVPNFMDTTVQSYSKEYVNGMCSVKCLLRDLKV
jgi:hypothetical protein